MYGIEEFNRYLGVATLPLRPDEGLSNLVLALEQLKLVSYCIPDMSIGRGGITGLGLDVDILDAIKNSRKARQLGGIITETGKLKMV